MANTPCFPQRITAMALTLGTTGMDSKTKAEVQAAFKAANAETGNLWTLSTATKPTTSSSTWTACTDR